ncbi:hypothetical protein DICPUDRAFT_82347 [Dictyostelium purpureum]|uniref:Uncharacterized protein n=1 Tax=Dictyostelium purpureum TaxID=5786 RepID=F0ZW94_DICPU|nr:uncharacterized protein DICPUDRAFT_82347 [Dictyostelium purpureum]EGC31789.1 hypothetical protein DICPUDRAFT_82347 [Dictyostelium purpureum]|eukprot:XP_003291684.1 hypothetical protein DICPUDRAFT_82347 [Dictyostelium purpureum]
MQSIIRSINNCKKFTFTSNLVIRNYSSNKDGVKSFEEFKRERDLLRKKSDLVQKLTQLRIAGGKEEQISSLSQEIKSIEKQLDPSLVSFVVQSKEQKEKDLEQWKLFIEKKGIKTKSELKNVNRFEFERFKNTGFLDNQEEQDEKVDQQRNLQNIYKQAMIEDLEESVLYRDPYQIDISSTSLIAKKDELRDTLKKFAENIKNNPEYKKLAFDFLDPSIPLKDKIIFKEEDLKESDVEEFTEEEYKQFKKDLKALYRIEDSGKQALETNLRNIKFLQQHLVNHIDENGNIDIEGFQKNPIVFENSFNKKFHPLASTITNHSILTPEGHAPMPTGAYDELMESEIPLDISDPKVLKRLAKEEDEEVTADEESEDSEDADASEEDIDELDISEKENMAEIYEKDLFDFEEGNQPLEDAAELAEGEEPEFIESPTTLNDAFDVENLDETPNVDVQDMTPEEIMQQQILVDGRIKDSQKLLKFETETPEYASTWALNNITKQVKEQLEQERIEQLEKEDPELIRNFIKYKVDVEKEVAKKRAEEESQKYTLAKAAIERDVLESIRNEPQANTIYNKNTGKIHIPKKKHSNCLLCKDPNWELDPLNVPFLTLYVTTEGDLLPRAFSGNCLKHQKKIAKTFKHAKSLGLFNYKNGEFAIEDPNVYSLSNAEMEEYRKWYMGDYSKEEWEEVIDEFGELDEDDVEEDEDYDDEEDEIEEQPQIVQPQKEDGLLVDDIRAEYGVETKEMFNYGGQEKNK